MSVDTKTKNEKRQMYRDSEKKTYRDNKTKNQHCRDSLNF
jgi:hypothetical protein